MQFLAAAMPLGPAPTTQMRLFETMTASPSIALFFAGLNHCQHLQIPANLPHTASDRFARQVYEQPTRMLAGGRLAQRVNRLPRLPPTFSNNSTSWRGDRRSAPTPSDSNGARLGLPTVARIKPTSSRSVIMFARRG